MEFYSVECLSLPCYGLVTLLPLASPYTLWNHSRPYQVNLDRLEVFRMKEIVDAAVTAYSEGC